MSIPTQPIALWANREAGLPPEAAQPSLAPYPPTAPASGAAAIICPGGCYSFLAPHEGAPVAEWLARLGIAAFVLSYRIAPYALHPGPLRDAARAMRLVRANAAAWGLDPARLGLFGFSAGGHLAATLATHWDAGDPAAADPIARVSSRPDALALIYPVVTLFAPNTHADSRANLLGEAPTPELVEALSAERQVTPRTPPTFLVHSADDMAVPCANSLRFAQALAEHGVPVELQLYERGGHGYGLGGDDPLLRTWPERCAAWLARRGL